MKPSDEFKAMQPEWELIRAVGYVSDPWPIRRKLRTLTPAQQLIGQVIIEKTIGRKDGQGPERKLLDYISISQFAEATGLTERTIYNNLDALIQTGMFIRELSDKRRRSKYRYGISFIWLKAELAASRAEHDVKQQVVSQREADVIPEPGSSLEVEKGESHSPLDLNGVHPQKKSSKEATSRRKRRPPDPNLKHWAWQLWKSTYPRKKPPSDRAVRQRFVDGAEEVGREILEQVLQDWLEHSWDPWGFSKMIDRARRTNAERRQRDKQDDDPHGYRATLREREAARRGEDPGALRGSPAACGAR